MVGMILTDIYFDACFLRRWIRCGRRRRMLWWTPTLLIAVYGLVLSMSKDFVPANIQSVNIFLLLLVVIAVPKAMFAICSALGLLLRRAFGMERNYGDWLGGLLCAMLLYIIIYGSTFGVRKLNVVKRDLYFKDLPLSFDEYKIVHISDLHIGTYRSLMLRGMLNIEVDSINAQHADMIAFTGDIQNVRPEEIVPFVETIGALKAKDGVFSILGNHDYATYSSAKGVERTAMLRKTMEMERSFGWHLLLNDNVKLHRGGDSIIIAGEENDGEPPFPHHGDVRKSLADIEANCFTIMLQHDPSAWKRSILPDGRARLTLSGHTHGGQFSLFGLRLTNLHGQNDRGIYDDGDGRLLHVSTGLGGLVPFRFGMPSEITVLTLHRR